MVLCIFVHHTYFFLQFTTVAFQCTSAACRVDTSSRMLIYFLKPSSPSACSILVYKDCCLKIIFS